MVLDLDELAFACAVFEGHVLQLAFAAGVADGAVERMIAEEQFDGGLARLRDFGRFSGEDLAFGDGGGAGGLELGNFFLTHDAHAARGLKREAGIVTERGNLDAGLSAGVNEQRSAGAVSLFPSTVKFTSGIRILRRPELFFWMRTAAGSAGEAIRRNNAVSCPSCAVQNRNGSSRVLESDRDQPPPLQVRLGGSTISASCFFQRRSNSKATGISAQMHPSSFCRLQRRPRTLLSFQPCLFEHRL